MTLRVVYEDWQAGGLPAYQFGAQLLNWLAPETSGPTVHIKNGRHCYWDAGGERWCCCKG